MTKRKREKEDEDEGQERGQVLDVYAYKDWETMQRAVSSLPREGSAIRIFRYPEAKPGQHPGGRPRFVAEIEPVAFTPQYVQTNYGGGKYLWQSLLHGEMQEQGLMEIEGPPIHPKIESGTETHQTNYHPPTNALEAIQALQTQFQTSMMELSKTLMTLAFQNQNRGGALDEDKIYERVERFIALANKGGGMNASDILGLIQKGMDLAAESSGNGGPSVYNLVEKYADRVLPILEGITTRTARGRMPTEPVHPQMPAPPHEAGDPITMLIREHVPHLLHMARFGANTEPIAEIIWGRVPEPQHTAFLAWLQDPMCLTKLAMVVPDIRQQEGWWIDLREDLVRYATESSETGEAATPDPEPSPDVSRSI